MASIIVAKAADEPAYWSNELGWVEDRASATVFASRDGLNLPIGGAWKPAHQNLTE